jgi:hypothetical protein
VIIMKRRLALVAFALIANGVAIATPVVTGTSTDPTGVTGLVVDGATYNVTFSLTNYDTAFPAFGQPESGLATLAALALAAALNGHVSALNGGPVPGPSPAFFQYYCLDVGPKGPDSPFACGWGATPFGPVWRGYLTGGSGVLGCNFGPCTPSNHNWSFDEAADFTLVSGTPGKLPEPATLGLLGLGCAVTFLTQRKRRRAPIA